MTEHEHADLLRAIADGEAMEIAGDCGWRDASGSEALAVLVTSRVRDGFHLLVRIKPKPRQPREWWGNVYEDGTATCHESKEEAGRFGYAGYTECIRVREVMPDAEAKELLGRVRGGPWLKPDGAPKQGLFLPEDVANAVDAYLERQI